jgi:hypothetical protein
MVNTWQQYRTSILLQTPAQSVDIPCCMYQRKQQQRAQRAYRAEVLLEVYNTVSICIYNVTL